MLWHANFEAERRQKGRWLVEGQPSSLCTDLPSAGPKDGHGLREKGEKEEKTLRDAEKGKERKSCGHQATWLEPHSLVYYCLKKMMGWDLEVRGHQS